MKSVEVQAAKPFVPRRIKLPNGIVIYPRLGPDGNLTPRGRQLIQHCAKIKGHFPSLREILDQRSLSTSPASMSVNAEKKSEGVRSKFRLKKCGGKTELVFTKAGLRAARAEWDEYVASGQAQREVDAGLTILYGGSHDGKDSKTDQRVIPPSSPTSKKCKKPNPRSKISSRRGRA